MEPKFVEARAGKFVFLPWGHREDIFDPKASRRRKSLDVSGRIRLDKLKLVSPFFSWQDVRMVSINIFGGLSWDWVGGREISVYFAVRSHFFNLD